MNLIFIKVQTQQGEIQLSLNHIESIDGGKERLARITMASGQNISTIQTGEDVLDNMHKAVQLWNRAAGRGGV